MRNGFRSPAQGSKKEQLKTLDVELKNTQMASRVTQMMVQQLMQNIKTMGDDLGSALNQLYELQYKYTALQKHLNLNVEDLNKIANAQRLIDFNEASLKEDEREGLLVADVVAENSTVTITTSAVDSSGADKGIFRSRLTLSESGVPDLNKALLGKKVGEKVTVTLNNLQHEVEILAIRNPSAVEATSQEVSH